MAKTSLYSELSALTSKYLELNTGYILDELIENHLNIDPIDINKRYLKQLLVWLEVAASLIIEDQKVVQAYLKEVAKLAEAKDDD